MVRTSQSGLIPDVPGPLTASRAGLVGISGLIPDTIDLEVDLVRPYHNRTSKSGLLFDPEQDATTGLSYGESSCEFSPPGAPTSSSDAMLGVQQLQATTTAPGSDEGRDEFGWIESA